MKRIASALAIVLALAGCAAHSQVPPNPTVFTCNGVTTFTPLNQASPATALTYTDASPGAGNYCYIAQSVNNLVSPPQVSLASNTASAVVTGTASVALTWLAPTSGVTPTGYIVSRAPAIAVTIGAPALGTTPKVAEGIVPAFDPTIPATVLAEDYIPVSLAAGVGK